MQIDAYYFKSVKLRLDKNNISYSVIFMTSYQASETLQKMSECLRDQLHDSISDEDEL